MCDNLISALKLLANHETGSNSLVEVLVVGLQERSRLKMMEEHHEASKIGDLEKNLESLSVVKPKFTTDFREAVVREGADELTLRKEEEGMLRTFIDTTNVGDSGWRPPFMDEDWDATCQVIYNGVEGAAQSGQS